MPIFNSGGEVTITNPELAAKDMSVAGSLTVPVPTGVAVVQDAATLSVSWSGTTTRYAVYRDNVFVSEEAVTTYVDSAVVDDTEYSYHIIAIDDSAGFDQFSAPTADVAFTYMEAQSFSTPTLVGFKFPLTGSDNVLVFADSNPPPIRNYDSRVAGVDRDPSAQNSLEQPVTGIPVDGQQHTVEGFYWDNNYFGENNEGLFTTNTITFNASSNTPTIVTDINIDTVTSVGFTVRAVFSEPCSLKTYADSNNPPTTLVRDEPIFYDDHNGNVSGLTPDTDYNVMVVATFANGYELSSSVISQRTAQSSPVGGFTNLVIPENVGFGSFGSNQWDSSVAPLSKVYSSNEQYVSTQEVLGEQAFRMQLEPASNGSARNHMQAYMPSSRVGYETEFDVLFETGFDFGRDQKAAKCGFGMGMQSLSQLTDPKRTPGGSDNATDGFSFRLMYNGTPSTSARFAGYYYGADKVATYGSSGEYLFAPSSDPIQTNRRYRVRMQVLVNDGFGSSDGTLRIWIDDVLLAESTGRKILGAGDRDAPWVLQHETFWGGGSIAYAGNTTSYIVYFQPRHKRLG
ncbi:polysaccharide lyase [uncultured Paraglaciecola sp.]|uniref:polysaccharide lyase n=1 Tax=uncultured Paraglaciecola sp. TaxID=1765024 RepID=UPI0026365345|nr:hypothetical protein [uncultured Paraglaciecola sp.]